MAIIRLDQGGHKESKFVNPAFRRNQNKGFPDCSFKGLTVFKLHSTLLRCIFKVLMRSVKVIQCKHFIVRSTALKGAIRCFNHILLSLKNENEVLRLNRNVSDEAPKIWQTCKCRKPCKPGFCKLSEPMFFLV